MVQPRLDGQVLGSSAQDEGQVVEQRVDRGPAARLHEIEVGRGRDHCGVVTGGERTTELLAHATDSALAASIIAITN